jgi:hypothetical protein
MKIALIGNCQVVAYKKLLETSSWADTIEILEIEVWRHRTPQFAAFFETLKDCDWIITQELGEHYAPLNTANLRNTFKQLCVIQNIYFSGFHPDCIYVGPMGNRAKSPIGDYHSEYIFKAWQNRIAISECVEGLLNYPPADILQKFEKGQVELGKRELSADVPVSDLAVDLQSGPKNFFVFNHPRLALHRAYLARILAFLSLPIVLKECDDPLARYGLFPVYPAVQDVLGIKTDETFEFVAPDAMGGHRYHPEAFCAASYALYEKNKDTLQSWKA